VNSLPTLEHPPALIVLEGADRVRWRLEPSGNRTAVGVWPDTEESTALHRHLAECRPLLVVLDAPVTDVCVFRDELRDAPPAVTARAMGVDDPFDLRVPALDWLPEPYRTRGLNFWDQTESLLAAQPSALLPRLLLDTPHTTAGRHVRFARRSPRARVTPDELGPIVAHLFPLETTHAA
jgi:hypothetical protein